MFSHFSKDISEFLVWSASIVGTYLPGIPACTHYKPTCYHIPYHIPVAIQPDIISGTRPRPGAILIKYATAFPSRDHATRTCLVRNQVIEWLLQSILVNKELGAIFCSKKMKEGSKLKIVYVALDSRCARQSQCLKNVFNENLRGEKRFFYFVRSSFKICSLRAKPQHCVAASHRTNLRRRGTHRENFRCACCLVVR